MGSDSDDKCNIPFRSAADSSGQQARVDSPLGSAAAPQQLGVPSLFLPSFLPPPAARRFLLHLHLRSSLGGPTGFRTQSIVFARYHPFRDISDFAALRRATG